MTTEPAAHAEIYAAGTALLEQDKEVANAEGIFAQALTNGLLAIAAHSIADHPAAAVGSRSLPPASKILDDLVTAFDETGGVCWVPTSEEATELTPTGLVRLGYERKVAVQTDQLRDALRRTNAPRHGRGAGGVLTDHDIKALVELDAHPALRSLSGRYVDEAWRRGRVEDLNERARAEEYLEFLNEDERAHRLENVPVPFGAPSDDVGVPLQECPVCGAEALIATGGDEMGYGIAAGVCFVCSYQRSDAIAHEMNLDAEWEVRWEHL